MLTLPGKTSNILTLCLELEKKTEPKIKKIKGIKKNRAEISDKEKIFKKWRGTVRSETHLRRNSSWLTVGFSRVIKAKDNGMTCWAVGREIAHGWGWWMQLQLPPEKYRGAWMGAPSKRQGRGPWQSRGPHAHFLLVPRAHGAGLATNCHSAPMHNSCPHVPICASFN